jgi:hypothetical protein
MSEVMTQRESQRLIELERIVQRGLKTSLEVAAALVEIREKGLYRLEFKTFKDYCASRWNISEATAYRAIELTKPPKCKDGDNSSHDERNITQVNTKGDQWETFNKDMAAQRHLDAEERRTRVNGVAKPDPPGIAKARANGKIPHEAVVTIEEPEEATTQEEIAEEHEEAAAQSQDEMGDDDWLETLPLFKALTGVLLRDFKIDALAYRHLEKARAAYLYHAQRELKKQHRGPYGARVIGFLKMDGPQKWNRCASFADGGCEGTGVIKRLTLECPKCRGRGYWISAS